MIILGPVAVAKNGVIGGDNDLPWYLPEDLKHFKEITDGHTVLMGRLTFDSIIKQLGKPLPNRHSVLITRQKDFEADESVSIYHHFDQALAALSKQDVYIIGGAQIFELALPRAEYMYVTHVVKEYLGDVFFPKVEWSEWKKIKNEPHDGFEFAEYKRLRGHA